MAGKTPVFTRQAQVVNASAVDVQARTVKIALSSETPYLRSMGWEVLSHDQGAIDETFLGQGLTILWGHDHDEVRGTLVDYELGEDKVLRGTVKLSRSAKSEELLQNIADGAVRYVSVGYGYKAIQLDGEKDGVEVWRVTDWVPYEASFVSVPADATVGIGRSAAAAEQHPDTLALISAARDVYTRAHAAAAIAAQDEEDQDEEDQDEEDQAADVVVDESLSEVDATEPDAQPTATPQDAPETAPEASVEEDTTEDTTEDSSVVVEAAVDAVDEEELAKQAKEAKERAELDAAILALGIANDSEDLAKETIAKRGTREDFTRAFDARLNARNLSLVRTTKGQAMEKFYGLNQYIRDVAANSVPDEMRDQFGKAAQRSAYTGRGVSAPFGWLMGTRTYEVATPLKAGNMVVPDFLASELVKADMPPYFIDQLGVRKISLSHSATVPNSAFEGELILGMGEQVPAELNENVTFDRFNLVPHRAALRYKFTDQMLKDASLDVEGIVRENMFARLDLAKQTALLKGVFDAQNALVTAAPTGLAQAVGVGAVAGDDAKARDAVIDAVRVLGEANAPTDPAKLAIVVSHATLATIRKTLYTPTGNAYLTVWDNTIEGIKVFASSKVPNDTMWVGAFNSAWCVDFWGTEIESDKTIATGVTEFVITTYFDLKIVKPTHFVKVTLT